MNTPKRTSTPNKLTSEMQLARIRLAKAESQLKSAKEQARLAKRRRKEAKEAARRAKKQARLAKDEVAEAKLVMAEAEEKLAQAGRSAARARARKKAAASPRKKQPAQSAASRAPKYVKPKRPTAKPTKPVPGVGPAAWRAKPVIVVPRDFEALGGASSVPGNQATVPAGPAVQETRGGTAGLEKPVTAAPEASQNQWPDQNVKHQKPKASIEPGE